MSRIRVLERLARLEREELEHRRRELATLDGRVAALRARARQLRDALPAAILSGWDLPGGPAPLGRWLAAAHRQDRTLRREAETLEAQRERALAEVEAQLVAKRRHERILERARAERRTGIADREQRQLDELAALCRPRDPGRSP